MEFELNDEIKKLGISKLQRTNENVCVYNGNGLAQPTYYKGELQKTLSELKEKMVFCGHFGYEKKVQKIIILISNIIVVGESLLRITKTSRRRNRSSIKSKSIVRRGRYETMRLSSWTSTEHHMCSYRSKTIRRNVFFVFNILFSKTNDPEFVPLLAIHVSVKASITFSNFIPSKIKS